MKEIEVGEVYLGTVVNIQSFGAFINLTPGKDGLLHISRMDKKRVNKVEDVMNLGSRPAEKYDLIPGVKSKFERGMDLYGPDQDGPDRDGASPENTEGRASEPGYLVFHR